MSSFTWTSPSVTLMRLKKSELQRRCRNKGVDDSGTKQDMVDRLYPPEKQTQDEWRSRRREEDREAKVERLDEKIRRVKDIYPEVGDVLEDILDLVHGNH